MSSLWLTLIPTNPRYLPSQQQQKLAHEYFSKIAPKADALETNITTTIDFFDCGGAFERIHCPSCRAEIPIHWWVEQMDSDYSAVRGFTLPRLFTPCCQTQRSLDQLLYHEPQGFARFSIRAVNSELGELNQQQQTELETMLGTQLHVIYKRI